MVIGVMNNYSECNSMQFHAHAGDAWGLEEKCLLNSNGPKGELQASCRPFADCIWDAIPSLSRTVKPWCFWKHHVAASSTHTNMMVWTTQNVQPFFGQNSTPISRQHWSAKVENIEFLKVWSSHYPKWDSRKWMGHGISTPEECPINPGFLDPRDPTKSTCRPAIPVASTLVWRSRNRRGDPFIFFGVLGIWNHFQIPGILDHFWHILAYFGTFWHIPMLN